MGGQFSPIHKCTCVHGALASLTLIPHPSPSPTHTCLQVLCASNEDHTVVDPVIPPEASNPGDRISFEGFNNPPEAQINPKKKTFEKISPDLTTDSSEYGMICRFAGLQVCRFAWGGLFK